MPITTAAPIHWMDQDAFHKVDYQLRGIAFDIHNEFGRFFDEKIYQEELVRRGRLRGLAMIPEFRITVALEGFRKDYLADCMVDHGVIIETKTVNSFSPSHRGQALNYLFLCGLNHGALFNFRSEQLQHEFISTKLTLDARRQFHLRADGFTPLSPACESIPDWLRRIFAEWGTHLDPALYRDALLHFLGGATDLTSIHSDGSMLGHQSMPIFSKGLALSVTASVRQPELVAEHQRRLLKHTALRGIQWINLHHETIELRTIEHS